MKQIATFLLSAIFIFSSVSAFAEEPVLLSATNDSNPTKTAIKTFENKYFNHMDLGVTVGTTGIGFDIAMPIGNIVKVRTGLSYVPPITVPLHFNLMSYSNGVVTDGNFAKAQALLKGMTGFDVNQEVTVDGKPDMLNWKFLIDVYPFRNNKHWHFTAGFYLGGKKIATAVNGLSEAPTLVGVGMYNSLYNFFTGVDEWGDPNYISSPIYNDVYIDPEIGDMIRDKFLGYGSMGVHMGDYVDKYVLDADGNPKLDADGNKIKKPFMMVPGNDATLRAEAIVNRLRPYVGFGYGGYIDKAKRLYVGFDCGAMFWGGHPKIITYNGVKGNVTDPDYAVDLTRDVENVGGKVGDYIKFIKALKVYPVLDFRISYCIF